MTVIKPFNCHCVPEGPGYSASSFSGYPTNLGCINCFASVTPLRIEVTYSPATGCPGSWSNTEYAGPFICNFVSGFGGNCLWETTEKSLEVDTGNTFAGAQSRCSVVLDTISSVYYFTVTLRWRAVQEGLTECDISSPRTVTDMACRWRKSFVGKPNCLAGHTLDDYANLSGFTTVWRIGFRGLRHKIAEPSTLPTSVSIAPKV